MAYFKIVTTVEKRGVLFTLIPHQWEQNGVLLWPQHLNHSRREALRSNAASVPEDGWTNFPCVIKVDHVNSFKDGLMLEKNLSDCTDTEAEERLFSNITLKRNQKEKAVPPLQIGLDDMFDQINRKELEVAVIQDHQPIDDVPVNLNNQQESNTQINLDFSGSFDPHLLSQSIPIIPTNLCEEISHIKEQLGDIKVEFQNFKKELKQQVKEDFGKINLVLDKIFEQLADRNNYTLESKVVVQEDILQEDTS